jgi:hypothetical protein
LPTFGFVSSHLEFKALGAKRYKLLHHRLPKRKSYIRLCILRIASAVYKDIHLHHPKEG